MVSPDSSQVPMRTVSIPATYQHGGDPANRVDVTLKWVCPRCGQPRGEPFVTSSWDGDKELTGVHGWTNPCGHVDHYDAIRKEAGIPVGTPPQSRPAAS